MGYRAATLATLAQLIVSLKPGQPVRIAIDGRTASGKTTLAAELALAIRALDRPVILAAIDDFHHPKALRYARGRFSAEGYYHDARDLAALRRLLLDPLAAGGDRIDRKSVV